MAAAERSSARNWPRRAAAAALAAAFIVLAPVAVASAWIRGTVLSTSGYVAAVSNVAASPAVRTVIREAVTAEVSAVLPRAGGALAGPLRAGLADLAGRQASAFMAGPAFERAWVAANQFAHAQLIGALSGSGTPPPATGEQVTLNLVPLVSDVLHGVTGRAITPPSASAVPAACRVPGHVSASPCLQIPLFPAAALARLRHAYRVLTSTTSLALILTPLAFAGALAASSRRRRTLLSMLAGGTCTLLLALTAAGWLQSSLIARTDPRYQPVTSAILHALTGGFFTLAAWCVAGSLALAVAALLSGPYRWAAAIRRRFRLTG